jgi:competence protein ComFC
MSAFADTAASIAKKLFTADYPYCIYCGAEYGADVKTLSCAACEGKITGRNLQGEVSGFCCASAFSFEGPVQGLVHRFKYSGAKYLGEKMANLMYRTYADCGIKADAVTNVPIHRLKKRRRGYDQSEVLAKALSKLSGLPYLPALKRLKDTPTQTHLDREQRIENVKNAFEAVADIAGKHILLIDDVLTTGSTAAECAMTLIKGGAAGVHILTFAKAAD